MTATAIDHSILDSLGVTAPIEAKPRDKLGQDDFLKLMITQLRNQDPMKPMQNGEFLGQIAQFGTVSGIQDLQKSFADFSGSIVSNQALQAAGLVGRTVRVESMAGHLPAGGALEGALQVPSSSSDVTVSIYDASGQLVRRLSLGPQPAGEAVFRWDGLRDDGTFAAPGVYALRAEAAYGDAQEALATTVNARVDSVTLGAGGGMSLALAGLGSADFSSVRQIM